MENIFKQENCNMKTKEELNAIKEEVETVNEKLQELTEEELERVTGGQRGGKAQVYLALNTITGED